MLQIHLIPSPPINESWKIKFGGLSTIPNITGYIVQSFYSWLYVFCFKTVFLYIGNMRTWTCLLQLLWANVELLFHFRAMSQCSCIISLILLKLQSTWDALAKVLFRIPSLKNQLILIHILGTLLWNWCCLLVNHCRLQLTVLAMWLVCYMWRSLYKCQ